MMRKYSLTVVALSTLFALQGHSEFKLGVMGGGNFSTFTGAINASTTINSSVHTGSLGPSGLWGYQVGGLMRYEKETWFIESDVLYTSRSAKWHGEITDGSSDVRTSFQVQLNQIEVPIMGYYKLSAEGIPDFRFGIGMFFSYGIGKIKAKNQYSNVPGSVVEVNNSYSWSEFGFRRINFGGIAGFGTDIKLGEESKLGIELRAQTTFNDMIDKINPAFGLGGDKVGLASVDLVLSYEF